MPHRPIGCPHKLGISTGEVRDELPFHTSRETIVITRMWNLYKMLIYLLLLLCATSIRQGKRHQISVNCTLFTGLRLFFLWIKAGYRSHLLTRLFLDQLLCHRNHRCITSFELVSIMDIRSCWVVVAMVTSKSTKCSAWSVRVSSATLYLHPCMKEKTSSCLEDLILKGQSNHIYVKTTLHSRQQVFFPGYTCWHVRTHPPPLFLLVGDPIRPPPTSHLQTR